MHYYYYGIQSSRSKGCGVPLRVFDRPLNCSSGRLSVHTLPSSQDELPTVVCVKTIERAKICTNSYHLRDAHLASCRMYVSTIDPFLNLGA